MEKIISEFKIYKLFAKYDLDLKIEQDYNIIIGENGVGKTTILRIIDIMLRGDLIELRTFDFEKIEAIIKGSNIVILKEDINNYIKINSKITDFNLSINTSNEFSEPIAVNLGANKEDTDMSYHRFLQIPIEHLDESILLKITDNTLSDKELTLFEEFKINKDYLKNFLDNKYNFSKAKIDIVSKNIKHTITEGVIFLRTSKMIETTNVIKEKLKINDINLNTDLDYINEYLDNKSKDMLEIFRNSLAHGIDPKNAIFDEDKPINKLVEICNKYLVNKELIYDSEKVELNIKYKNGICTSISETSLGEKNIINTFARLLFSNKDIILIFDEPELSMSIEWQESLLIDVINTEKCNFFLVATHSPYIFNNELQKNAFSLSRFMTEV